MTSVRVLCAAGAILVHLLAGESAAAVDLAIDAPPELAAAARRISAVDQAQLAADLRRAGLPLPPRIRVTLLARSDPDAARIPRWIVGLASGDQDVLILPERVMPYPYDSIESVFRHEVAHLAMNVQARGGRLPRWFHEGVAVSVDTGWGTSGQLRLLLEMVKSPGTAAVGRLFASNTQPDAAQAYGLSAALVADVQRRHGATVPGAIAARVGAGIPFARAFQIETGETPDAAAARAWASYRRWTNWVPAVTGGSAMWTAILALAIAAFVVQRRRRLRSRARWAEEEGE